MRLFLSPSGTSPRAIRSGSPRSGASFQGGSFVWILRSYIKSHEVFYCPAQPRKYWTSYDQNNPNNKDEMWVWNGGTGYTAAMKKEWPQESSYGMNLIISGGGLSDAWQNSVPTETMVKEPARTLYVTEATWVDLLGGMWPGRIGQARFRHQSKPPSLLGGNTLKSGGANVIFCDYHVRFVPGDKILQYPESEYCKWPMK